MTGIQFVTNEKGEKVAVQLDLKKYGELWEDIQDVIVAESRRGEKTIPFAAYIASRRKRTKTHV